MEQNSKTLELLKGYTLRGATKSTANRDEVLKILKSVIENPAGVSPEIADEAKRILLELDEKELKNAERKIDDILNPKIH